MMRTTRLARLESAARHDDDLSRLTDDELIAELARTTRLRFERSQALLADPTTPPDLAAILGADPWQNEQATMLAVLRRRRP